MAKKTREDKEKIVSGLKNRLQNAASYVISDYHGLSVSQMQELKNSLSEVGAEFSVAKNTLLKLSAKEAKKEIDERALEGPTAVLFSGPDPIESIKKLVEFIKKYELPKIKSGTFEGKLLNKDEILAISRIPGRQELYAKVVGRLGSPIYGIVGVLNANLRNLLYVLNAIRESTPPAGGPKGGAG